MRLVALFVTSRKTASFDLERRSWSWHKVREMTELPENVTLDWLGREFIAQRDDLRALRAGVDMLIRLVIRVDRTLDAVREDIRSLWSQDGDLRRRIEALEGREP